MLTYKDEELLLIIDNAIGFLYNENKLQFKGSSKVAIKLFFNNCKNETLKEKFKERIKQYDYFKTKELYQTDKAVQDKNL